MQRINVDSGRPLESKAHYSRALRVGNRVLQSGTTAIDLEGNILGTDIRSQIAAILDIARSSMGAADGRIEDTVRVRAYVVGTEFLPLAAQELSAVFKQPCSFSVVPISRLARPTQLIEIELEAVDPVASMAAQSVHGSRDTGDGVELPDRVLLNSIIVAGNDDQRMATNAIEQMWARFDQVGVPSENVLHLRLFSSSVKTWEELVPDIAQSLRDSTPSVTCLNLPVFGDGKPRFILEAEASRSMVPPKSLGEHPWFAGFSSGVIDGDDIYLSTIEPVDERGELNAADDWSAQRDSVTQALKSQLETIGASLDDVVVRRFFTHQDAAMNRDYGEGPAWFAGSRPTALGCRVAGLVHRGAQTALEAFAVRGAGTGIEWRKV